MDSAKIEIVPIDQIDPMVSQSRELFDDVSLKQLAANLKLCGQLQAGVSVFDEGRKRHILLCGERRFRALKIAGLSSMELKVIRGQLSQGQMLAINLAENIQRESLNPIEKSRAFAKLMRLENLTASEVAQRMSVSNATVSRSLSLLELPVFLQDRIVGGSLPVSVAATIARAGDDETRLSLANQYGVTLDRDGVIAEVNRLLKPGKTAPRPPQPLRLNVGGVSLIIGGKQSPTLDGLLVALGKLTEAATKLKEQGVTKISALGTSLKAS